MSPPFNVSQIHDIYNIDYDTQYYNRTCMSSPNRCSARACINRLVMKPSISCGRKAAKEKRVAG